MAQQVKVLATKGDPWDPYCKRRQLTLASCPLIFLKNNLLKFVLCVLV